MNINIKTTMRKNLWYLALASVLVAVTLITPYFVMAFDTQHIIWNKEVCSTDGEFCFRGNIDYDGRSIRLNGRLSKSCSPGIVTFWFKGPSASNESAVVDLTFRVKGKYSEIVRKSVYTGYWGLVDWYLDETTFKPIKK